MFLSRETFRYTPVIIRGLVIPVVVASLIVKSNILWCTVHQSFYYQLSGLLSTDCLLQNGILAHGAFLAVLEALTTSLQDSTWNIRDISFEDPAEGSLTLDSIYMQLI
ncbi:hypothetical protein J6590_000751 [Homalodisca vitripennis]|nr:hypothetical protein J6590_000751 [Homalodisca vitripennis]